LEQLIEAAHPIRASGKAPRTEIEGAILASCRGCYLTLRELSQILGRSENTVRQNYLSRMTRSGRVVLRYPYAPNHPDQAYTASQEEERLLQESLSVEEGDG
jgi:hypothetical protein